MTIYMKVTEDEYELPEAVADSIAELARFLGKRTNVISSCLSHVKHIPGRKSCYKRVEINDEDD